jgi:hypothetical protein
MSAAFNGKLIFQIGFVSVRSIPIQKLICLVKTVHKYCFPTDVNNIYACFQLEWSHSCWKHTTHDFMNAFILYLITVWPKHKEQSQLTCHKNKCPLIHRNKLCSRYYWGNSGAHCGYLMHYSLALDWLSADLGRKLQTVSWDALYCKTSTSSSWGMCVINKVILDYSYLFLYLQSTYHSSE